MQKVGFGRVKCFKVIDPKNTEHQTESHEMPLDLAYRAAAHLNRENAGRKYAYVVPFGFRYKLHDSYLKNNGNYSAAQIINAFGLNSSMFSNEPQSDNPEFQAPNIYYTGAIDFADGADFNVKVEWKPTKMLEKRPVELDGLDGRTIISITPAINKDYIEELRKIFSGVGQNSADGYESLKKAVAKVSGEKPKCHITMLLNWVDNQQIMHPKLFTEKLIGEVKSGIVERIDIEPGMGAAQPKLTITYISGDADPYTMVNKLSGNDEDYKPIQE